MDVNILLYDDFETLDAFGPVEILGHIEGYQLHYYSLNGGKMISQRPIWNGQSRKDRQPY